MNNDNRTIRHVNNRFLTMYCLLPSIVVIRCFSLIKLVAISFPFWPVVDSVKTSIASNDLRSWSYKQLKPPKNAFTLFSGPEPIQTFLPVLFHVSSQPAIIHRLRQNERPQISVKTRACKQAVEVKIQFHVELIFNLKCCLAWSFGGFESPKQSVVLFLP